MGKGDPVADALATPATTGSVNVGGQGRADTPRPISWKAEIGRSFLGGPPGRRRITCVAFAARDGSGTESALHPGRITHDSIRMTDTQYLALRWLNWGSIEVATVTDEGRKNRIREALQAHEQLPASKRETLRLPWRGATDLFPVVQIEVDVPLLNASSHRLQAMLEGHPGRHAVKDLPFGEDAQRILAEVLQRRHHHFDRLKENLRLEGQRDPGVITREGVLINANTRAVALRELDDEEKRWIRVAVLPPDASAQELAELELQLQVQDPLKDDYRLTEELLFIEEMARDYGKSEREIALALRWAARDGRSARRGESEVQQRRRILALIREMQNLATPAIPLTFFDDKLEQLKALEKDYFRLRQDDLRAAERFRDNWLLAALGGASSVHDLRAVNEDFVSYLRSRLEEDGELGSRTDELLAPKRMERERNTPPGVDLLSDDEDDNGDGGADEWDGNAQRLLDLLAADLVEDKPTVDLPGSGDPVDREAFRASIGQAVKGAVKDRKAVDRAVDLLDEPIAQLREAVRLMTKTEVSYRGVRHSERFDQSRRGQFGYQLKKARRQLKKLEELESE